MRIDSTLSQIQRSGEPPSMPELLFREYAPDPNKPTRARISEKEYHVGTAVWVAQNLDKYPPRQFPLLSQVLQNYVGARIEDRTQRDPGLSFKLGQWSHAVQRVRSQNEGDATLLAWCHGKLVAENLMQYADPVAIRKKSFEMAVPSCLGAVLMAQAKDAADKQRDERGRR